MGEKVSRTEVAFCLYNELLSIMVVLILVRTRAGICYVVDQSLKVIKLLKCNIALAHIVKL
jgi:hypothetical protein